MMRQMFSTYRVSMAAAVLALASSSCTDTTSKELSGGAAEDGARTDRDGGGPGPDVDAERDAGDADDSLDAPTFPLTPEPYTTLQRVWAPKDPPEETKQAIDDGELEITDIDEYLDYNLGVEGIAGKDWAEHTALAPGYPGPLAGERRSLLYFWQSTDPQLIDEESPVRFEGVTDAPVGSTFRPQDHLTAQIFESHVRSARRISEASGRDFDFAFVSGDFTDNGQKNEVQWSLDILTGGVVHPDSGEDNDPVPGPGNDFTDPFASRGIGVPWYMAIGNHETLYVGTLPATDAVQEAAVGTEVFEFKGRIPGAGVVEGLENGFRDASTVTAEVRREGPTPADEDRRILPLDELLETIRNAPGEPNGHGFGAAADAEDEAYYSFRPAPGKPIRFIVLNTLYDDPAHVRGGIEVDQFDWLKSELDAAERRDELVIVGGHHRLGDFTALSDVDGGRVKNLLASYENVLLHVVGHGHKNAMEHVEGADGGLGYWELMCASTVDVPLQSRIFELVYDGDGYLSVYVTNLGHNAPRGTLPHWARQLTAARKVFFLDKEVRDGWENQHEASNLLLRYNLPEDLSCAIESHTWPKRVESVETLEQFPVPR